MQDVLKGHKEAVTALPYELALVHQVRANRGGSQESVTGRRVLDSLNGFTTSQAEDGCDHAEHLAHGHVNAVHAAP